MKRKILMATLLVAGMSTFALSNLSMGNGSKVSLLMDEVEALSATERVCYYDGTNKKGVCEKEVGGGSKGASCVEGSWGTACTGTTTVTI